MTEQHSVTGPLVGAGSRVFGAIAVLALAFGGVAGMSGGGSSTGSAELAASLNAAEAGSSGGHPHANDDGHVHDDGHGHDDGHAHDDSHVPADGQAHGVGHDHGGGSAGSTSGTAARPAGSHDHAPGEGHDDHGEHAAGSHAHAPGQDAGGGAGHDHGDGAAGAGHDDHEGHAGGHDDHGDGGHDDHGDGGHHDHYAGCADTHPVTIALRSEVQRALDSVYKDVVALVALGFHPYFDSLVPGGYPPGGEGISHWLNPNHIDNGNVLDPWKPEAILLDEWNNPIGMMFINDVGVAPKPVYVNDDGTACSPWHPHTDMPARVAWYYYRAIYDREMGGDIPEQTPEMMHVWAIDNPAGVYAAHDLPPSENRQGPPGPLPSYLSDGIVVDLVRQLFVR
jgi:hypothetical protein